MEGAKRGRRKGEREGQRDGKREGGMGERDMNKHSLVMS